MDTIHQIKAIVEEEHALEKDGSTEESAASSNGKKKAGKQTRKGKAKKKPPPSREEQYDQLGRLYVRYYGLLRQLEQWHDGMAQPQIRQDVKTILELVICRILALRRCLVELLSDDPGGDGGGGGGGAKNHGQKTIPFPGCIDVANILQDMKLSPSAMEPVIPRYIREESEERRRELGLSNGDVAGNTPVRASSPDDTAKENPSNSCNGEDISSTRGKEREVHYTTETQAESTPVLLTEDEAAAKVQAIARGHIGRIQTKHRRDREAVLVGMELGDDQKADELQSSSQYAHQKRKEKQRENREAYSVALEELRDELQKEEGSTIYDGLYEERMRWISEQITTTQSIPESLEDFYLRDKLNSGGNECEGEVKKDTEKGEKEVEDSPNRELKLLIDLLQAVEVFEERWKDKSNYSGACDKEVAKDTAIRQEIEQSITKTVDEAVLLYLQRLKASNDAGGGKKGGKSGGTKKKKGAAGKKGGAGANKKKKEKPFPGEKLCGSMATLEMLHVLETNGLVENYSQNQIDHTIDEFVGSEDALSSDEKVASFAADGWNRKDPTFNQLQLAISEYCILPNASSAIKESICDDDNVRAILFFGPEGCGKQSMVKTVATQLGGLLITLSPKLIENDFLDKSEATRLIHMIFTIARDERYGPVVLHIDECEHFFQSATGKLVDKSGPVRFQKDLLLYKNQAVQNKDRFIVIGSTEHPELLDSKIIKYKGPGGKPEKEGMFEKFLFFPPPDYISRLLMWKSFISEYARDIGKVQPKDIDFSLLASKSQGLTAGSIRRCVELTRKSMVLSEMDTGCKESWALSEVGLLDHLETDKAVGDEDRSRVINFAKSMEQKSKINVGVEDKKKGKGKAS